MSLRQRSSHDPWPAGHQSQVSQLCAAIDRHLGLDDDRLRGLVLGASIHDLGKIAISHETLTTPGRLSPEQCDTLRQHPGTGHQIAGRFPWPWPIAEMILQHHERLDGSGYPRGPRGDDVIWRRGSSPSPTRSGPWLTTVPIAVHPVSTRRSRS